ncbi:30S ribosomal protein S6 [Spiroplasma sp. TIUS-1]|uniref:30S ribosomal protein S6 n=1 Tax=Spiroplasma sp. TIUS-1 TaxID=216963 RepID=UPI0013990B46|nr:30S ribosomal protein S6 [Spiroplasma sp. TIUS-1]QHX35575.1 30S ribosomal protein S6 [Spiroplasma sp. TIUS-1]
MKRTYEVMYILDQNTPNVEELRKKLEDILLVDGGKIVESEDWGIKKFAYLINKKDAGRYVVLITKTSSENILEFQRIAGIDRNVIRTMVINTESEQNYIQTTKLSKTDVAKMMDDMKKAYDAKKVERFNRFNATNADGTPNPSYDPNKKPWTKPDYNKSGTNKDGKPYTPRTATVNTKPTEAKPAAPKPAPKK